MPKNIVEKIFEAHKVHGEAVAGQTIGLSVDQVYTQDATGTMTWLEFEAMGAERVKTSLAVSYVDHNMLQSDFMNADDHAFLQSAAARFGAYFSRPGNGISHQVHLERFSRPGAIALGTDSHTPTGGGMGMIAVGVGGLEAATVMAGSAFELKMPDVVLVRLTGKLRQPWVTAMDVILEILRRLTVKGGVGKIMEYGGAGVSTLSVPERATITNMGAELGATTSVFPSDERTRAFLSTQAREHDWVSLQADEGAKYSDTVEIDLSELQPMVARPHSPDNVVPLKDLIGLKINQVCIGSCTNSSYTVMKQVALVLDGRVTAPGLHLFINPGSKQVSEMLSAEGLTAKMLGAGARVLESACGPCIGMGGAPSSGAVSVRSYNRNFKGRSGTSDARVHLANPLVGALFALKGEFCEPFETAAAMGLDVAEVQEPKEFLINDNMLVPPLEDSSGVEVLKGPNIKDVPLKSPLSDEVSAEVLLKLGDNITTDDIMPAGSKVLPLRSNIPAMAEFVFNGLDPSFAQRAREAGRSIVVGAENYGQGSSREHAAIAPMYLGLEAVIAKSFARIHRSNLINFGVLPLVFADPADYGKVRQGDILNIKGLKSGLAGPITVQNSTQGYSFTCEANLNEREAALIASGGLLPHTRNSLTAQ